VPRLRRSGDNQFSPSQGKAGTQYLRVGRANHADGKAAPAAGAPTRYRMNTGASVADDVFDAD
jgi:hypothetical protein